MNPSDPHGDVFCPDTSSREFVSKIFEQLPVAVFLVDRNHRIAMLNERTARLAGMTREEIFRDGCFGLFCDKKTHFEKCPGHASLYSGKPWDGEVDFESRHYHVFVRPIHDGENVPYSLIVLDDRTEERRSTELLNTLVSRLERLLLQSSRIRWLLAAFSMSDNAGNVRDTAISGAAELLGASVAYLVRYDDGGTSDFAFKWFVDDAVKAAFGDRPPEPAITEALRAKGEFAYVIGDGRKPLPRMDAMLSSVGCHQLLASDVKCGGRVWGRVGFVIAKPGTPSHDDIDLMHEVTSLVEVALRRGELIDEVERKERGLIEAVKRERAAARAKTMFLATMSHEIRTPLNAIIGFSESLGRETGLTDSARECADGINRAAGALLDLLNDILDLSKLEAGGGADMMHGECNLAALFAEMSTIFRYSAKSRGIELRHSIAPDFPVLALSGPRMRQILLNLIGNAVKFTAHGFVEWTAKSAPAGDAAVSLEIDVRDSGSGIPENSLESIFDPFVQVRGGPADHTRQRGTGLGLPIVRRLIEACGGTVRAESELGKGSVFHIRIASVPTVAEPDSGKADAPAGPDSMPPRVLAPDFSPLVVDDVPVNLQVFSLHLRALGVRNPVLAGSGAEALAKIREKKPPVVFTDIWMPEMNGSQLASEIKSDPDLEGVPVVAVTADSDVAASFDDSVFDDILTKPVSTKNIALCLRRLFGGARRT